jgi:hypothetical protein
MNDFLEGASLQTRAIAEDEMAEKLIDDHYIARGNYNRPILEPEHLTNLPTRDDVKGQILDAVSTTEPKVFSGEKGPLSHIIEEISTGFDELEQADPELYGAYIDELVAAKDLRNSLPKEADFANVMEAYNSIFGFDTWNGRSDKERDGFENKGADFLVELADKGDDQSKQSLDAIFSTGWKGITMTAYVGKSWILTPDSDVSKEQAVAGRSLFDAKIASHREFQRSGAVIEVTHKTD